MRKPEQELTCTLDHLEKAQERLTRTRDALTKYMAGEAIVRAAMSAREALELLENVKEGACEQP